MLSVCLPYTGSPCVMDRFEMNVRSIKMGFKERTPVEQGGVGPAIRVSLLSNLLKGCIRAVWSWTANVLLSGTKKRTSELDPKRHGARLTYNSRLLLLIGLFKYVRP